jgi:hypothetical protein
MKKFLILIAMAILGAGVVPATANGQDGFIVTTPFYVSAFSGSPMSNPNGAETGYYMTSGESLQITASGYASCSYTDYYACYFGPDGNPNESSPGFIAPDLPPFSLIARVGTSGAWTFIGSGPTTFTATTSGELYFAYNDDFFPDNVGGFDVVVPHIESSLITDDKATCRRVMNGSAKTVTEIEMTVVTKNDKTFISQVSEGDIYHWSYIVADDSTMTVYYQGNDLDHKLIPHLGGKFVFNTSCVPQRGPKVIISSDNSEVTLTNAVVGRTYIVAVKLSPRKLMGDELPLWWPLTYYFYNGNSHNYLYVDERMN